MRDSGSKMAVQDYSNILAFSEHLTACMARIGFERPLRSDAMSDDRAHTAPTLFLLMAQYQGRTVIPLDEVCRDFFGHLTVEKLLRKVLRGDIALPIVRIETSQKAQ